jgi:hypothetical protein
VTTQAQLSSDEAKQVVPSLGTANNDESFQTVRIYVADDNNIDTEGITVFACGWFQINGKVGSLSARFPIKEQKCFRTSHAAQWSRTPA